MRIDLLFAHGAVTMTSVWQQDEPEWPPHPDRLYQALVAGWAGAGQPPEGEAALRWLEALPPPAVHASGVSVVPPHTFFVPPNDTPFAARKPKQRPSLFPHDPCVSYVWNADSGRRAAALEALCLHVSRVGHPSSIVVASLGIGGVAASGRDVWLPGEGDLRMRFPQAGRLDELKAAFAAGRRSPIAAVVGYARARDVRVSASPRPTMDEIVVMRGTSGRPPRLVDVAAAAKALRDALMRYSPVQPPPEIISGHASDGSPTRRPHMAVVPLANVGWEWADGRLLGLGVVLPRGIDVAERRRVMTALARWSNGGVDGCLYLASGTWHLAQDPDPDRASLRPGRYARQARMWTTVTPVVLDRHPKRQGDAEESIARSCLAIGLPRPLQVAVGREPAVRGVPGAGAFFWSGRRLVHAAIQFAEPVGGPVMLGAGRFRGLGLMLAEG
jgi:CRISPR-associated protein Csb2